MTRARVLLLLGFIAAGGTLTWWLVQSRRDQLPPAAAGTLAIQWRGSHRGEAVLPARVNWCPVNRTGVLEAIVGDTGVAVVIYEANALTRGPHAVVMPGGASAVSPRPGASVVMRWPRDSSALLAYASQGGLLDLRLAPKLLSGTLSIRMRAASGSDSLMLTGNFTDVPVVAMAVGCP
jgi:hypothetical protein